MAHPTIEETREERRATEVPESGTHHPAAREVEVREGETLRDEPSSARGEGDGSVRTGHDDPAAARAAATAEDGHSLIPPSEAKEFRRRWDSIQASFIDEPRQSVQAADRLVAELTEHIAGRFASERSTLEERWNRGEEVSTETLRQSVQRYRGFFDRLLRL